MFLGSTFREEQTKKNKMSFLNQFTKTISSLQEEATKQINDLTPIAKRTARFVSEKLGSIDDISELPEEYINLEKKCDLLKEMYNRFLIITQTYEIESYDYPPNIKESVNELSKTFKENFQILKIKDGKTAEKVLNNKDKVELPKTLAHELSKVGNSCYEELLSLDKDDKLVEILLKYSQVEKFIGDKRIEQDQLIIKEFNDKIKEILSTKFSETDKLRKKVDNSRLNFDIIRNEIKVYPERQESLQTSLDNAEDELVNDTAVAVESMKNLIQPNESINLILLFNKIQLEYYTQLVTELTASIKQMEEIAKSEQN